MPAHLLEPAIVGPIFADKDRVHRRLHVVVNAPGAGAAEEGKRSVVRIEHHLLRLAGIGPNIRHPTVAKANMGALHGRGHTIDQNDFTAPVELVGFIGVEARRDIGRGRSLPCRLRPPGRVAPHGIISAAVTAIAQP